MPKGFEHCIKQGGRVRTKKMPGGKFMHICFMGGSSYAGEVKKRKTKKK